MIPRKKILEGLYGDKKWVKQEMSLDDEYEMSDKEVYAMIGIVLVTLGVWYLVGAGVWNLAVYITK